MQFIWKINDSKNCEDKIKWIEYLDMVNFIFDI